MASIGMCVLFTLLSCYATHAAAQGRTYRQFFQEAVDSYLTERWYECTTLIQKAVQDHSTFNNKFADCDSDCGETVTRAVEQPRTAIDFYDITIRKAGCARKCLQKHFPDTKLERDEIDEAFDKLMPYDYWQMCAYKAGMTEVAANAAYTLSVRRPDHEQMKQNLQFYLTLPEISREGLVDLKRLPNQASFMLGVVAYNEERWDDVIVNMEEAVSLYFEQVDICEAVCERKVNASESGMLSTIIADAVMSTLRCKLDCTAEVAMPEYEDPRDYLPEHFHYLQFAYFKANNLLAAAECVATFQLFKPNDEVMKMNLGYYTQMAGGDKSIFRVRKEVSVFHQRQYILAQVLVNGERSYMNTETTQSKAADPVPRAMFAEKDDGYFVRLEQYTKDGVTISMEGKDLGGELRIVADGLLTQEQCDRLMELSDIGATQGDGYSGREHRSSPFTNNEKFEGLTVVAAAELAKARTVSQSLAEEYLAVSEYSRSFLNTYYNLETPMYFHYTHLVKRTALPVDQQNREDLSHPVHADNCHIQKDGSCLKEKPAYIDRDFSGLLYLNGDFEGGNFFFAYNNKSVQTEVKPECGRLVAFPSSHYHAVLPLTKGKRYAVAMWFTLNQAEQEISHPTAWGVLKGMQETESAPLNDQINQMVNDNNYRILAREPELNGPERFTADGLLTDDQCQRLIDLANRHAVVGDGYQVKGASSPFTQHETFAGMTVEAAANLVAARQASAKDVQLYLDTAEIGRAMTEAYFGSNTPLYFDYTHLACRTSHPTKTRDDLSHPIHSDNCIIQPDNSCNKVRPAYIQRDYSALIYLNDDFRGGEFFFTHKNKSIQASLKPYCGLIVAFNAGNYHGVKAVEEGSRCSVALWFTKDRNFNEEGMLYAKKVMKRESRKPEGPKTEL